MNKAQNKEISNVQSTILLLTVLIFRFLTRKLLTAAIVSVVGLMLEAASTSETSMNL
jgi:hypothetical protein